MSKRKAKKDEPEYGFKIVMKEVHGEMFPVKVYDPEPSPDPRGAEPRRLNMEDFIAAGLGHLIEDIMEDGK